MVFDQFHYSSRWMSTTRLWQSILVLTPSYSSNQQYSNKDQYQQNFIYQIKMIKDDQLICPQCENPLLNDRRQSITICTNKSCKGLVVENGHITYEQEVNLHENEDQNRRQTRFGGFESRKDQFITTLMELMHDSNSKTREKIYKKFEKAEQIIQRLAQRFDLKESCIKEIVVMFRELLNQAAIRLKQQKDNSQKSTKSITTDFSSIAVIAFNQVAQEKKKREWVDTPLMMINLERLIDLEDLDEKNVLKCQKKLQVNVLYFQDIKDKNNIKAKEYEELDRISRELGFQDEELKAIKTFYDSLMNSNLIKGQKPTTIYRLHINLIKSVVQYCISQLSPKHSHLTVEGIAEANRVTKDTIKNVWSKIWEQLQSTQSGLIPEFPNRRNPKDLHSI